MKPRVLVVYHFLPNYREGVFRALLADTDIDYELVSGSSRPGQEGVPHLAEIPHTEVRNVWLGGRVLWQRGLLRELSEADAVIFLGNWQYLSTWVAQVVLKRRGTPTLLWTHGWKTTGNRVVDLARKSFYMLSSGLLLYGEHGKRVGVEEGFPPSFLHVVGNSLPLAASSTPSAGFEFGDSTFPLLIWIGRLVPSKQPSLLVDALRELEASGPAFRLLSVGEGPELDDFSAAATALLGSNYLSVGSEHDPSRLASYFSSAVATVVPASGGLAIPHSLLHGVPVIADDDPSKNGPDYEVLRPGENGITFSCGSANDLARAIETLTVDGVMWEPEQIAVDAAEFVSPKRNADRISAAVRSVLGLG